MPTPIPNPTPTPGSTTLIIQTPSTVQDVQSQLKPGMIGGVNRHFADSVAHFDFLFGTFWNHPVLTPQQSFDTISTNAGVVLGFVNSLQSFLNTVSPGIRVQKAPNSTIINPDGTVTVGP